jgi:CRISPR/Cas system CSM-associated protein Csm2 small subunit
MDYHVRERCEEQFLDCDYKYAGCDVKYRRKNKDEHMKLDQQKHQTMYQIHTLKMTEQLQEMLEKQNQTMKESKQRAEELEEKMTNLEQAVAAAAQEKAEEIEKLTQKIDQLVRKLQDQEQRFDQQMQQLKLEFNHHDLRDQHDQPDQPDPMYAAQAKQQKATPISATPISSTVPPRLDIANPCVFTIDNFAERKANQEKWESPIMTTPNGYKLLLEVWPSGKYEGKDNHVSVWVQYIREEGEEETKWPARVTMNLELLQQKWAPQNIRKVIFMESFDIQCDQYTKKRRYYLIGKFSNTLISHKALDESQLFLKNNSLKMQITLLKEEPIENDF